MSFLPTGRQETTPLLFPHLHRLAGSLLSRPPSPQRQTPLGVCTHRTGQRNSVGLCVQTCNSDEYAAVPRKDMARMLQQKGFLQGNHTIQQQQQREEETLGDILTPGVTPEFPRYVQCQWAPLSGLDPDTLTFPGGAPIQLHAVPPAVLPRIPLFYVCTRCGKVFWEGSHFGRVLSMFQDVLHIADEDTKPAAAAQQD